MVSLVIRCPLMSSQVYCTHLSSGGTYVSLTCGQDRCRGVNWYFLLSVMILCHQTQLKFVLNLILKSSPIYHKSFVAWGLTQPSLDASWTDQRSVTAPTHLGAIQSLTQDPCLSHVDSPKVTPTNVIYSYYQAHCKMNHMYSLKSEEKD